jgi:deazaflavin-dependent oxidoreductase (nitroreductase family)
MSTSNTQDNDAAWVAQLKEASDSGWIAEHRELYLRDGAAAHLWDSTFAGGPGPLPTLLLTTRGRKSGQDSLMPLLYGDVPGGYAIIASKGGATNHPAWYHNLRAHPDTEINLGPRRIRVTAHAVLPDDPDYGRLWEICDSRNAGRYRAYQSKTTRPIPVIRLTPAG